MGRANCSNSAIQCPTGWAVGFKWQCGANCRLFYIAGVSLFRAQETCVVAAIIVVLFYWTTSENWKRCVFFSGFSAKLVSILSRASAMCYCYGNLCLSLQYRLFPMPLLYSQNYRNLCVRSA